MKNNCSPSYQIFTLVLKYTISCVSLYTGDEKKIGISKISNRKKQILILDSLV